VIKVSLFIFQMYMNVNIIEYFFNVAILVEKHETFSLDSRVVLEEELPHFL
jgi:hypothetical protein